MVYGGVGEHCNIDADQIRRCLFYVGLIGWELVLTIYSTTKIGLFLYVGDLGVKYVLIYVIGI